jgi:hypothetical protein
MITGSGGLAEAASTGPATTAHRPRRHASAAATVWRRNITFLLAVTGAPDGAPINRTYS